MTKLLRIDYNLSLSPVVENLLDSDDTDELLAAVIPLGFEQDG